MSKTTALYFEVIDTENNDELLEFHSKPFQTLKETIQNL